MSVQIKPEIHKSLQGGLVIPACPLALNAQRRLDERRQRALVRYYIAAGAGGLAVGVHTTQFAIREPKVGLFKPVLELAAAELRSSRRKEAHSAEAETRNPKPEIRQSPSTKPPAEGIQPEDARTKLPSWEGSGVGAASALPGSAAGETPLRAAATIGIAG